MKSHLYIHFFRVQFASLCQDSFLPSDPESYHLSILHQIHPFYPGLADRSIRWQRSWSWWPLAQRFGNAKWFLTLIPFLFSPCKFSPPPSRKWKTCFRKILTRTPTLARQPATPCQWWTFLLNFNRKWSLPGDSKWPVDALVGGHTSNLLQGHLYHHPQKGRHDELPGDDFVGEIPTSDLEKTQGFPLAAPLVPWHPCSRLLPFWCRQSLSLIDFFLKNTKQTHNTKHK